MVERVLLVEHDELLAVLFELALREAGYDVTRVRSGAEAISRLTPDGASIDLVVTDIGFRDGPDGWQVARRARAVRPDMPVIYMTGARADEWRPQHVPLGVLLLKPFPVQQLVEIVGALLAAKAESGGAQRSA
ncbi:MAG: response regulator [Caulobacteraceae bacterium]